MADVWYYTRNGQQQGPVDNQELNRLARDGHVSPDDLVWTEGMISWARAGDTLDAFRPGQTGESEPSGLDAGDILGSGEKEPRPRDPYGEPELDRGQEGRGRGDRGRGRNDDDLFGPAGHEETGRRRRRGGEDRDYDRGGRRPERGRGRRDDYDRDYDRSRRRRGPRDDYGRGRRGGPRSRRRPPKRGNGGLVVGLVIGGVVLLAIVGLIIIGIVSSSSSGAGRGTLVTSGRTQKGRLRSRSKSYYRVKLSSGKAYVFDVTSSGMDTKIELRDESGRSVRNASSGQGTTIAWNTRLVYVPRSSGTYQVVIRPRNSWDSGPFRFTFREATPMTVGQTVAHRLPDGDEMMLYEVNLKRNDTYTIDLKGERFGWDTHLFLYDDQGNKLRDNDDGRPGVLDSFLSYRPFQTGKYYIGVTAFRQKMAGSFTLTVSGSNVPKKVGGPAPQRIRIFGNRYSRFDSIGNNQRDAFLVTFLSGRTYTIDMKRSGNVIDPYLDLFDPKGIRIQSDANGGAGIRDARITYRCTRTGTYRIECSSTNRLGGAYRLEIRVN